VIRKSFNYKFDHQICAWIIALNFEWKFVNTYSQWSSICFMVNGVFCWNQKLWLITIVMQVFLSVVKTVIQVFVKSYLCQANSCFHNNTCIIQKHSMLEWFFHLHTYTKYDVVSLWSSDNRKYLHTVVWYYYFRSKKRISFEDLKLYAQYRFVLDETWIKVSFCETQASNRWRVMRSLHLKSAMWAVVYHWKPLCSLLDSLTIKIGFA